MKIPMNDFYYLRHGQTEWNRLHIAMGQQDIPLNEIGVQQAFEATELINTLGIKTIVSSPLSRAYETACIVAGDQKESVIVIDDLKEACWGNMEGQSKEGMSWIESWRIGAKISNGELYQEFSERIERGLKKALAHSGPVLIVSHGGSYWPIQDCLGLPFCDLPNAIPIFHRAPSGTVKVWQSINLFEDNYTDH